MMETDGASLANSDEHQSVFESNKRPLPPSSTNSSPIAKKSNSTIKPILFVAPSIIGSLEHESAKKAVAAELKKLEIEIERVQITLGRNVLVHPKKVDAKSKLLGHVNLFGSTKSIDFSQRDNRPSLVLKSLCFKDAQLYLESGELSKYGVAEVVAFKSRIEGREPKIK